MPQYCVEKTFQRNNGSQLAVVIYFDYFMPPHFQERQDKSFGSIQILQILHAADKTPIIDLQLEEMISLRRICWDYLEERKLLVNVSRVVLIPE